MLGSGFIEKNCYTDKKCFIDRKNYKDSVLKIFDAEVAEIWLKVRP